MQGSSGDLIDHAEGEQGPVNEPPPTSSWFYRWRNGLMAKPAFRRFAGQFPFSKRIVRSQARSLFDLMAGFTYSQTVYALVQGGVIQKLQQDTASLDGLATQLDMTLDQAERILLAGISIGLITRSKDDRFGLTLMGAALAGDAGILAMVRHHRLLYKDLADPLSLFRAEKSDTHLSRYYQYAANPAAAKLPAEDVSDYSELMALSQAMVSAEIIGATRFKDHSKLWDIGGGKGVFARHALISNPKLEVCVLDLPGVVEAAKQLPENEEFGWRLSFQSGDFLKSEMPTDCSAATSLRVLFDHDDAMNDRILTHVHSQLFERQAVYIAEPMAETKGAEPIGHAYYGMYLKAMGAGRVRTFEAHKARLEKIGFHSVREIPTHQPIITRLIEARKH